MNDHNHDCFCGGLSTPHQLGTLGCYRELTEAPKELANDFWEVAGHVIHGNQLRGQRLYWRYACGCWSCPKSDDDSSL